jgi:ABC-2 type transport system ATP-binding protein
MTNVAALEAVGLGRRYGTKWGLRDCSLTVAKSSITGLVGPNGAGKSTLLRLAAGLSRPTTGGISIFGEQVKPNTTRHLRRMGYFDQLRPLYPGLRVDETLRLGQKLNKQWDNGAALGWLNELDIPLTERVGHLSLGQQALVALALCMGKRPDLLLLDEPVASLDPLARRQLLETLLGSVADEGTTVFLSSHIISELEPVCDHLIILSSSSVRISGSIEDLLGEHHVLVGASDGPIPRGLEIVSSRHAARQTNLLVRGDLGEMGQSWQVLKPDLEEIVLAYLSDRPDEAGRVATEPISAQGGVS